jgi:hypothetical protein
MLFFRISTGSGCSCCSEDSEKLLGEKPRFGKMHYGIKSFVTDWE